MSSCPNRPGRMPTAEYQGEYQGETVLMLDQGALFMLMHVQMLIRQ